MARRSFQVRDVTEILVHWDAGRSQSEIADSLGMDRKTVKKYLAPALAAGMVPGSGRSHAEWAAVARDWFPQLADTSLRQFSWPLIEPHRDYIVAQLEAGVTKATIHQRLRDEHGLTASVASVKRWIAANLPEQALRAKVTVLGEDPPPGQEAADRLRLPGHVGRPAGWSPAPGVGIRDGAVLLAAPVPAPGAAHGPAGVDPVSCRGLRVLRRDTGQARAGLCSREHNRGSVPVPVM